MFRIHSFTRQPIKLFALLVVLLSMGLLVACTETESALPAPAGAEKGQNTFLLFYAEN